MPVKAGLIEILRVADDAYSDGFDSALSHYFNLSTGDKLDDPIGGDTLAEFVGLELSEMFDPSVSRSAQFEQAASSMRSAAGVLATVAAVLSNRARQARQEEKRGNGSPEVPPGQ